MALTDYSTSGQAAVQQGYSAYTTQPTQGYAQTTQAYGQQGYGTYGQPTDVSYTVTYGHTTHTTSYGQSPTGSTNTLTTVTMRLWMIWETSLSIVGLLRWKRELGSSP
uniref:RNA-binding protein EWS-like protein n=1 Tax=Castor canadensis TaxID=51338 RepID=A0A8C0WHE5_CASCN